MDGYFINVSANKAGATHPPTLCQVAICKDYSTFVLLRSTSSTVEPISDSVAYLNSIYFMNNTIIPGVQVHLQCSFTTDLCSGLSAVANHKPIYAETDRRTDKQTNRQTDRQYRYSYGIYPVRTVIQVL